MTDIKKLKLVHLRLIEQAEFYDSDYFNLLFSDDFVECFDSVLTQKKIKEYVSVLDKYVKLKKSYYDLVEKVQEYHAELKQDNILSPSKKIKLLKKMHDASENAFNNLLKDVNNQYSKAKEVANVFESLYYELIKVYPALDYNHLFTTNRDKKTCGFKAIKNEIEMIANEFKANSIYKEQDYILQTIEINNTLSDFKKIGESSIIYKYADGFDGIVYDENDETFFDQRTNQKMKHATQLKHNHNYQADKYNYVLDKLEREHENYLRKYNLLSIDESEIESKINSYANSVDSKIMTTIKNIINM